MNLLSACSVRWIHASTWIKKETLTVTFNFFLFPLTDTLCFTASSWCYWISAVFSQRLTQLTHSNKTIVRSNVNTFPSALINVPFMPEARQTASVSAKPCGLNFHRLGLPLIFICAHAGPQRVRFTDCGAEVFPVLGSATSTEVPQPH